MTVGILNDITRCTGCGACALACKEINHLAGEPAGKLDAHTLTLVERCGKWFVRRMCLHCREPACASVCPASALHVTPEGAVAYDAGKCIGCRYCMMACPFDVPAYEWNHRLPLMRKCQMCYEKRVRQRQQPACTQVCPAGATLFGDRQALIAEARRRIERSPARYVNHIYGVREAGGTSVLTLSPVAFDHDGLPADVLDEPYPRLTWRFLSRLPRVAAGAGAVLFGVAWVTHRRMARARAETASRAPDLPDEEHEA